MEALDFVVLLLLLIVLRRPLMCASSWACRKAVDFWND